LALRMAPGHLGKRQIFWNFKTDGTRPSSNAGGNKVTILNGLQTGTESSSKNKNFRGRSSREGN